jgi:hypothetical protein
MAAPFVATSRLSNIIQMITLSRQTGILRVIRGQGATRELGQIRFLDGEPVAALLGHLTGAGALSVLGNWGECQYAFDDLGVAGSAEQTMGDALGGYTSPMPSSNPSYFPGSNPSYLPGSNPGASAGSIPGSIPGRHSSTAPLSGTTWPAYGYQQSDPRFAPASPPSTPFDDLAALAAASSQGAPNRFGPAPLYSQPSLGVPGPAMPPSGPATGPYRTGPYGSGPYGRMQPAATGLLTIVPQRTAVAQQVDLLPLDRRERMVLLLVDGQRTVADLARLTRRTEPELQSVLTHLELLGLVRLAGQGQARGT